MAKDSYREYLKKQFTDMIDMLEITDSQKQFMKSRWLDQLLWFEGRAGRATKWSNRFRVTNVVGGVMIPALVSLTFNSNPLGEKFEIGWIAFGLSQVVAVSAALEESFGFAKKRVEYRKSAELLKSEGWKFLQLTSSYQDNADHKEAYPTFAKRVEKLIQEDVQAFMELAKENAEREKQQQEKQKGSPGVPNASENPKDALPTKGKG
ncbi:MAG: DUF4231 domain-containing protein [Oscillatoria sp. SIO1A7]|nr:DUF4231 domain-containing protein [Oscillatoria sp. SIO1A7]